VLLDNRFQEVDSSRELLQRNLTVGCKSFGNCLSFI
jgi:hypothetical protein